MYPRETIRDNRELELFLFGGVPETPDPVYERDFHSHSESRMTRKPMELASTSEALVGNIVGFIVFDPATGGVSFREVEGDAR